MKPSTLPAVAAALIVVPVFAADIQHSWSYEGTTGPAHWGELATEYSSCKNGTSQSPINIDSVTKVALAPLIFDYKPGNVEIVNNGHTIQVNVADSSSINVGGKPYQLRQLHFHSPSEHTINGKAADMVVHLVHQAADGQLGVVAVLMRIGRKHPVIDSIWSNLPQHPAEHSKPAVELNPADLLPAKHTYYNYSGSLTTPPCSEGVNWMVMQSPVGVSAQQVEQFTALFTHSIRPVQALNGRTVHGSE